MRTDMRREREIKRKWGGKDTEMIADETVKS